MCGLVGIIGDPGTTMAKVFVDLIRIDVVRGDDSTGAAVIRKGKQQVVKALGDPYCLLHSVEFHRLVTAPKNINRNFALLGHNRAATKGAITAANAHPFKHGDVIVTHNGTLTTTWALEGASKDFPTFDTDSETLTYALSLKGIDWVWEKLWGAAALAFWDKTDGSLNLIRNSQRPLCYARTEDLKYLIYASEAWMIRAVQYRHKLKLHEDKVYMLPEHYLFSFKRQRDNKIRMNKRKIEERATNYYNPRRTGGTNTTSTSTAGTHQSPFTSSSNLPIISVPDSPRLVVNEERQKNVLFTETFAKDVMSEATFSQRYHSCCFCEGEMAGKYQGSVVLSAYEAACPSCTEVVYEDTFRALKERIG